MRVIFEGRKEDGTKLLSEPMEIGPMELVSLQRQYALDGYVEQQWHRLDMVCDFCSAPRIAWRFEIEPGGMIGAVISDQFSSTHRDDDGKWGACQECANFILAEDWEALVQRALVHFEEWMHPIMRPAIENGPHACFRQGYLKTHPMPISVISDEELLS